MLAGLRKRVDALQAQRDELQAPDRLITPHLRRYEKAILALEGQPINKHQPRVATDDGDDPPSLVGPRRGRPPGKAKAGKGISDERLAILERSVRQIAEDQDDVTQVLVRAATGLDSSVTAVGFEVLRQRNVIRLVRQDGNRKVFRLTREALNAGASAD